AVKEMVRAGILLASRDIIGSIDWVRENAQDADIVKTAEKAKAKFAGCEIYRKTMGVIGLGAVGTLVANICRRMGMTVLGYDPYLSVRAAWNLDHHIQHVTDVNEIYDKCDYISIHVPATEKTRHMVGAEQIARMKDGVVLLNYSRDLLVDEEALVDACESGHIAHYVTDFANPVTVKLRGAIVTPHLAASTQEAEDNCAVMASTELRDYLENGNINNSVNFGNVDLGPMAGPMRIAAFHKNIPNMLGQLTASLASVGANIENMANRSSGEFAYTLIELGGEVDEAEIEQLKAIEGIYRVRVVRAH
ncbi:MAG: 3-phosphoglycerate dehydrogenase, partial [Atopobiaceae bacterium]|nr:3-phosphoglycerate dehydrogenase [Atopobiaceae bacterium]